VTGAAVSKNNVKRKKMKDGINKSRGGKRSARRTSTGKKKERFAACLKSLKFTVTPIISY